MEKSDKLLALLEAEDQIIAATEERLVVLLEQVSTQILHGYEERLQLALPNRAGTDLFMDALMAGWEAGIGLGVDSAEVLSRKSETGMKARSLFKYARTYGLSRSKLIAETTVNQFNKIITDGQRQGLTPTQITKQLLIRVPKIAKTRAKIIATTEIHAATQFGIIDSARQSRKSLTKGWQTGEDDKVRSFVGNSEFSHVAMQGTTVSLDSPFQVPRINGTTEAVDFPGDPAGSAGNIINCRCWLDLNEA